MIHHLASFFCILGLVAYIGVWTIRSFQSSAEVDIHRFIVFGLVVIPIYFILGWIMARLGVNLIQEIMAIRKARADETMQNAKNAFLAIMESAQERALSLRKNKDKK